MQHLLVLRSSELHQGVPELFDAYGSHGIDCRRMPILDQAVSSVDEMTNSAKWLGGQLQAGESVMVHCVGGRGRAGLVTASYLKSTGIDPEAAIKEVRRVRGPRALESAVQEEFVREFNA